MPNAEGVWVVPAKLEIESGNSAKQRALHAEAHLVTQSVLVVDKKFSFRGTD